MQPFNSLNKLSEDWFLYLSTKPKRWKLNCFSWDQTLLRKVFMIWKVFFEILWVFYRKFSIYRVKALVGTIPEVGIVRHILWKNKSWWQRNEIPFRSENHSVNRISVFKKFSSLPASSAANEGELITPVLKVVNYG